MAIAKTKIGQNNIMFSLIRQRNTGMASKHKPMPTMR